MASTCADVYLPSSLLGMSGISLALVTSVVLVLVASVPLLLLVVVESKLLVLIEILELDSAMHPMLLVEMARSVNVGVSPPVICSAWELGKHNSAT